MKSFTLTEGEARLNIRESYPLTLTCNPPNNWTLVTGYGTHTTITCVNALCDQKLAILIGQIGQDGTRVPKYKVLL